MEPNRLRYKQVGAKFRSAEDSRAVRAIEQQDGRRTVRDAVHRNRRNIPSDFCTNITPDHSPTVGAHNDCTKFPATAALACLRAAVANITTEASLRQDVNANNSNTDVCLKKKTLEQLGKERMEQLKIFKQRKQRRLEQEKKNRKPVFWHGVARREPKVLLLPSASDRNATDGHNSGKTPSRSQPPVWHSGFSSLSKKNARPPSAVRSMNTGLRRSSKSSRNLFSGPTGNSSTNLCTRNMDDSAGQNRQSVTRNCTMILKGKYAAPVSGLTEEERQGAQAVSFAPADYSFTAPDGLCQLQSSSSVTLRQRRPSSIRFSEKSRVYSPKSNTPKRMPLSMTPKPGVSKKRLIINKTGRIIHPLPDIVHTVADESDVALDSAKPNYLPSPVMLKTTCRRTSKSVTYDSNLSETSTSDLPDSKNVDMILCSPPAIAHPNESYSKCKDIEGAVQVQVPGSRSRAQQLSQSSPARQEGSEVFKLIDDSRFTRRDRSKLFSSEKNAADDTKLFDEHCSPLGSSEQLAEVKPDFGRTWFISEKSLTPDMHTSVTARTLKRKTVSPFSTSDVNGVESQSEMSTLAQSNTRKKSKSIESHFTVTSVNTAIEKEEKQSNMQISIASKSSISKFSRKHKSSDRLSIVTVHPPLDGTGTSNYPAPQLPVILSTEEADMVAPVSEYDCVDMTACAVVATPKRRPKSHRSLASSSVRRSMRLHTSVSTADGLTPVTPSLVSQRPVSQTPCSRSTRRSLAAHAESTWQELCTGTPVRSTRKKRKEASCKQDVVAQNSGNVRAVCEEKSATPNRCSAFNINTVDKSSDREGYIESTDDACTSTINSSLGNVGLSPTSSQSPGSTSVSKSTEVSHSKSSVSTSVEHHISMAANLPSKEGITVSEDTVSLSSAVAVGTPAETSVAIRNDARSNGSSGRGGRRMRVSWMVRESPFINTESRSARRRKCHTPGPYDIVQLSEDIGCSPALPPRVVSLAGVPDALAELLRPTTPHSLGVSSPDVWGSVSACNSAVPVAEDSAICHSDQHMAAASLSPSRIAPQHVLAEAESGAVSNKSRKDRRRRSSASGSSRQVRNQENLPPPLLEGSIAAHHHNRVSLGLFAPGSSSEPVSSAITSFQDLICWDSPRPPLVAAAGGRVRGSRVSNLTALYEMSGTPNTSGAPHSGTKHVTPAVKSATPAVRRSTRLSVMGTPSCLDN